MDTPLTVNELDEVDDLGGRRNVVYLVTNVDRATYSVEADKAELRHDLARLARKARCFSGSLCALWLTITLFVFAWHSRPLYKRAFPHLPAHLRDFVAP